MQNKLFINGQWQATCSGEMFDVAGPSDRTVFHQFSAGNAKHIDAAIVWINCSQPTFTEAPWAVTNNQASGVNWRLKVRGSCYTMGATDRPLVK